MSWTLLIRTFGLHWGCVAFAAIHMSACVPQPRELTCQPVGLSCLCSFVTYLSDIIVDGLAKAIIASLSTLHTQARMW